MSAAAELLRRHLPPGAALASWPGLEAWLDGALAQARERWPGVRFEADAAVAALAAALAERPTEGLAGLATGDLWLASACASGDGAAIAALDVLLRREVERAVCTLDAGLADDVAQQVREKLLVGPDARIRRYAGDGPLGAWLRATATRLALNARRPGAREVAASVDEQPLADPDPELQLLRARHRAAFRAAFERAVAQLSSRDRVVLRLATLDGLTLARIGAMYRKDASTVSRWLDQTRRTLLLSTREQLSASLGAQGSELESLMRAADSELTVSLNRLLASEATPGPSTG